MPEQQLNAPFRTEVERMVHMLGLNRMIDWQTLLHRREQARAEGKIVVWTNGCFDLLHIGHIRSLQAARALGDVVVVGLNSDHSIRQLKGPGRPFITASERAEVLCALECVDYVIEFDELTPCSAISRLKPDIHCKGADYAPLGPSGKPIPEANIVASYGGRIEFLPIVPAVSTSSLVQRILRIENPSARSPCYNSKILECYQ